MSKVATREQMIDLLEAKYPKLFIKTTEQFDGAKGGIWSSGENGDLAKDGHELFNYYAQDNKEVRYTFGVHREIGKLLSDNGWYAEWHDAGTIMFWLI